ELGRGGEGLDVGRAHPGQRLQAQIQHPKHGEHQSGRAGAPGPTAHQRRLGNAHAFLQCLPLLTLWEAGYNPCIMRSAGDILYNFHWVVPGEAARAAQPWAGGTRSFLKKRGIRAIINLRGRNDDLSWWRGETKAAAALGVRHFDAMLDSRKLPTRAML